MIDETRDSPAQDTPSGDTPAPPAPGGAGVRPPVVRISRRHLWMAVAAMAGLLALGVWVISAMLPGLLTTPDGGAVPAGAPGDAAEARRIQATLYYVSEDGSELVPVSRPVLYGATPLEQARRIVEAAVAPPPEGQVSAIPPGTTVRALFLADGRAYVDLGGPIASGQSGGTLNEALAVYAIVNALTVNLPDITAVQILVDGRQVDTLAGHLDLRYPLGKTLDWVRKGQ